MTQTTSATQREAERTQAGSPVPAGTDGGHEYEYAPLPDEQPDERLQRKRYGGVNWGAGFFGSLVVLATGVLLGAAGLAAAVATAGGGLSPMDATGEPQVAGAVAATVALVALAVMFAAGGYVAGRMSRFDGGRQGMATWLFTLVLGGAGTGMVLLSGLSAEVAARVSMPAVQLSPQATGLAVLGAAALAVGGTFLAAVVGGKAGCRYHRKVDDAAYPWAGSGS